jgi:hypothetical protein
MEGQETSRWKNYATRQHEQEGENGGEKRSKEEETQLRHPAAFCAVSKS